MATAQLPVSSQLLGLRRGTIQRHGAFKRGWLALRRIGRCHPWGKSGYDPVSQPSPQRLPLQMDSKRLIRSLRCRSAFCCCGAKFFAPPRLPPAAAATP